MARSGSPVTLLREPGTSLHRQLFLVLRGLILNGQWGPGAALPTEESLGQQYGVARVTVRRALQDLESEGLVDRAQGKGTFVRRGATLLANAPPLTLSQEFQKTALETRVRVISVDVRPSPPAVAGVLGLAAGDNAVHAVRVRHAGEVALMVSEAWLPERFATTVTAAALRKRPLHELVFEGDSKLGRVVQEVSAAAADPERARLLQTLIGAPLLRVTRLHFDTAGRPALHLTVYLSPERSRILTDIPAEDVDTKSAGYIAHDVLPRRRSTRTTRRGAAVRS